MFKYFVLYSSAGYARADFIPSTPVSHRHSQSSKRRETLKNILRQGGEGIFSQPPLTVGTCDERGSEKSLQDMAVHKAWTPHQPAF